MNIYNKNLKKNVHLNIYNIERAGYVSLVALLFAKVCYIFVDNWSRTSTSMRKS